MRVGTQGVASKVIRTKVAEIVQSVHPEHSDQFMLSLKTHATGVIGANAADKSKKRGESLRQMITSLQEAFTNQSDNARQLIEEMRESATARHEELMTLGRETRDTAVESRDMIAHVSEQVGYMANLCMQAQQIQAQQMQRLYGNPMRRGLPAPAAPAAAAAAAAPLMPGRGPTPSAQAMMPFVQEQQEAMKIGNAVCFKCKVHFPTNYMGQAPMCDTCRATAAAARAAPRAPRAPAAAPRALNGKK
jgi:hypothetical protein